MNKHKIILNMMYDKLIFVLNRYSYWNVLKKKIKIIIIFFILFLLLINLSITFNVIIKLIFKYKILKRKLILYFTEFAVIIKNIKFTTTAQLIKKQNINIHEHLNNEQKSLNITYIVTVTYNN